MDLGPDPESEHNLFLFTGVAKFEKKDYRHEIDSLSEQEVFEQLSSQVHNLARLLCSRYRNLRLSHGAFIAGAIIFAFLSLTKLFSE